MPDGRGAGDAHREIVHAEGPGSAAPEVLKFACGLSKRQIGAAVGIGATTMGDQLARAKRAGLTWPLPDYLGDEALERRLYPPPAGQPETRSTPDWATIHRELRRPDVTLALLGEEYRRRDRDGFSYSWFCEHYRAWCGRLAPTMRQTHRAGETLFSDYAGRTVEVVDGATGEVRRAQVFVATLGASSYTYAEASWTQGLAPALRLCGARVFFSRAIMSRTAATSPGLARDD